MYPTAIKEKVIGNMSDEIKLSQKVVKKRISLTLTAPYLEALDRLVEEGVYVDRREIIKDALRRLFRHQGLKKFVEPLKENDDK